MLQIKLALVLLCAGLGYFVYSNWQIWLESLDGDRKITAYALVGQNEFTTYPDVQDVLLKMGSLKGFWGQDVKQIQEQLETIPWVKGAVVRKIWPNRLSIWLSEYQPVAIWNKTEFVTKEGTVIFADFKAKNLVVKGVRIDDRGAWQVTLDNDIVLKLGRGDWKPKLDRFVTIYPQIGVIRKWEKSWNRKSL